MCCSVLVGGANALWLLKAAIASNVSWLVPMKSARFARVSVLEAVTREKIAECFYES